MRPISLAELSESIEQQLAVWPQAAERYRALGATERRTMEYGSFPLIIQHNPARAISSEAKVDPASIAARPCFLCAQNRPTEQKPGDALAGWDILVNPFPVFPLHLTIASRTHEPQGSAPVAAMLEMAAATPGLLCFFNGAHAGASAPDHLHFQAVRADELPLFALIEDRHKEGEIIALSADFLPDSPAAFWSMRITPDAEGMRMLRAIPALFGTAPDGQRDAGLVNVFIWLDSRGLARAIVVPRRRHRPSDYGTPGAPAVSPGALDVAGLMIAPRQTDFQNLNLATARRIYSETCFDAPGLIELSQKLGMI